MQALKLFDQRRQLELIENRVSVLIDKSDTSALGGSDRFGEATLRIVNRLTERFGALRFESDVDTHLFWGCLTECA